MIMEKGQRREVEEGTQQVEKVSLKKVDIEV